MQLSTITVRKLTDNLPCQQLTNFFLIGIPSLQLESKSDTDFLKTFSDETLEEAFPPTAQEAAELEAAEIFVNLMANLDILERKEEATRLVRAGLQKRLEAKIELVKKQELESSRRNREKTREQVKIIKPRIENRCHVKLSAKQFIQQPRKRS